MRILLAIVVTFHGLIHLMGPAKAFGWADINTLRLPISRTSGAFWLVAALLFLASGVPLFGGAVVPAREWWWVPALAAIAISQVLIANAWSDAKFGTFANLYILVAIALAILAARAH